MLVFFLPDDFFLAFERLDDAVVCDDAFGTEVGEVDTATGGRVSVTVSVFSPEEFEEVKDAFEELIEALNKL